MADRKFDSRQTEHRSELPQIAGLQTPKPQLSAVIPAIDSELTDPFALRPSEPADLVLNVGAGTLINPASGKKRTFSPINRLHFEFTGGTITLPAASGGAITVTPGVDSTLTLADGEFIKMSVEINSVGDLSVQLGDAGASEALATVAAPTGSGLPIGFITISNVGGVIQPIDMSDVTQFQAGGSGSSGSGTGAGIAPAEGYDLLFFDDLASGPSTPDNKVDATRTTAQFDAANQMYQISCDKAPTITTTGTSVVLSAAPSFTVQVNDIIYSGSEFRIISAVSDQQNFTLDSAFSADLSAAAGMISQAVYTQDLVNFGDDTELTRARDIYPDTAIDKINLAYFDTLTIADGVEDFTQEANISAVASNQGLQADTAYPNSSTFSARFDRGTISERNEDYELSSNPDKERLHIVFFCNPDKTAVTAQANITEYRVSFIEGATATDAGVQNTALIYTNQTSGHNVESIGVFSGRTRVVLAFEYAAGQLSDETQGVLEVRLDGLSLPRFKTGITTDAYYTEIDSKTIELDSDYSSQNLSLEVVKRSQVVDVSDDNSIRVSDLEVSNRDNIEWSDNGFENHISKELIDAPFTTIQNRAQIPSGLETSMGIERIMTRSISRLYAEYDNDGRPVNELDIKDPRIRLIGTGWTPLVSPNGYFLSTGDQNDSLEVTFYGTGLNILSFYQNTNADYRVSIDGGVEGSNIYIQGNGVLAGRSVNQNAILRAASGLPLGWHTVKVRKAISGGLFLNLHGIEILNESSQVIVNSGSGFSGTQKQSLVSQTAIDYKPTSMVGSNGGRVVTYLKDNQLAQTSTEVGTPQYLASADHSNEELIRSINFREFGIGRSDDFSTLSTTGADRAFTLDDGTTTLICSNSDVPSGFDILRIPSVGSSFTLTFVGTGLILATPNASSDAVNVSTVVTIDGVVVGDLNGAPRDGRLIEVCSGLAYGTHTVKVETAGSGRVLNVADFLIYQPKKPSIPAGAVELADYNVVADFAPDTAGTNQSVAKGVIRKDSIKEIIYDGVDWALSFIPGTHIGGTNVFSDVSGDSIEYTFYGTGIDWRTRITGGQSSSSISVTLNGQPATTANFSGLQADSRGSGVSYNTSTGVASTSDVSTQNGVGIALSGLELGVYTIKLTNNQNAFMQITAFDIITPIHINDISLKAGSLSMQSQKNITPVAKEKTAPRRGEAKAYASYDQTTNEFVGDSLNIAAAKDIATGRTAFYFKTPFKNQPTIQLTSTNQWTRLFSLDQFSTGYAAAGKSLRTGFIALNEIDGGTDVDAVVHITVFGELQDEE